LYIPEITAKQVETLQPGLNAPCASWAVSKPAGKAILLQSLQHSQSTGRGGGSATDRPRRCPFCRPKTSAGSPFALPVSGAGRGGGSSQQLSCRHHPATAGS